MQREDSAYVLRRQACIGGREDHSSLTLEKSRTAKAVKTDGCWIGIGFTYDHMIEKMNVHGFGCLAQLPGLCEAPDYGKWA